MDRKAVVSGVIDCARNHLLGYDCEITEDSQFLVDLNADSLDVAEIVMDVEDRFHVDISDKELFGLKTVRDMVDLVRKKIAAKEQGA